MVRVLWRGKVVSFEVMFEGVNRWWDSDSSRFWHSSEMECHSELYSF